MIHLKSGSRGPAVRQLQLLLNAKLLPSPRLSEDGIFGRTMQDALQRFQKSKGLVADGIVGPATLKALGMKAEVTAPPANTSGCKWMDIAMAELGIHENAAPGQHNARIVEYHQTTTLKANTDETPWCSSFVNWVMVKSGYRGTNNALARSWLDWCSNLKVPRAGAVVVIKKKTPGMTQATGSTTGFHVGFFVSGSTASVRILGGNQSDQVKYSNFMLSAYDVKGYRWPQ
jgi:uncharacterized protein (TIGR02594 family)